MSIKHLPYKNTGYFSSLMVDYLAEKEVLASFYHRFPVIDNFKAQIATRQKNI